jgi:hypothetical protein
MVAAFAAVPLPLETVAGAVCDCAQVENADHVRPFALSPSVCPVALYRPIEVDGSDVGAVVTGAMLRIPPVPPPRSVVKLPTVTFRGVSNPYGSACAQPAA